MNGVVVVDYGMGNIKSVQRGLEQVGAAVTLSSDAKTIATASRLVLPGVGAFENGMMGLGKEKLVTAIHDFVKTGNPLLGICLGMQMFFERSEEYGEHQGLGLISGDVKAIPQNENGRFFRKIPHIGWSKLMLSTSQEDWTGTCLGDIEADDYFYFVHSFMAEPTNKAELLAECEYEGLLVTAAVRRDNVTGLQFHPEKSGESGLKVLQQFISQ